MEHRGSLNSAVKLQGVPMRDLIFAINITLNGCCDHTKVDGSEEVLEHFR